MQRVLSFDVYNDRGELVAPVGTVYYWDSDRDHQFASRIIFAGIGFKSAQPTEDPEDVEPTEL